MKRNDYVRPMILGSDLTVDQVSAALEGYLARISPWGARQAARRTLINRLKHPEAGGHPESAPPPPPPSTGNNYANRANQAGRVCMRCGWGRGSHDIDGLRNDCDRYIPSP